MSQYEQENDLGQGGGVIDDDDALAAAWQRSEELHNAPVDRDTGMTPVEEAGDDEHE